VDIAAIVLIAAGIAAIVVGAFRMRGPLGTIRRLDETEANLERYETWRGKRTGIETEGPTGADIMRQQMRQRVVLWGFVTGAGVVAVLVGLIRA
jgi:hypothetical protein